MTIREQTKKILNKVWQTQDLHSQDASKYLYELSGLLGSVGENLFEYQKKFNKRKVEIMRENPTMAVSKVELLASDSDEFNNYIEAKILRADMLECIRGLKYRLRVLEDERRESMNL